MSGGNHGQSGIQLAEKTFPLGPQTSSSIARAGSFGSSSTFLAKIMSKCPCLSCQWAGAEAEAGVKTPCACTTGGSVSIARSATCSLSIRAMFRRMCVGNRPAARVQVRIGLGWTLEHRTGSADAPIQQRMIQS